MFLGRRARPGYAGLDLSKPMLLSVLMPIMASGLPIACIALLQFASPVAYRHDSTCFVRTPLAESIGHRSIVATV